MYSLCAGFNKSNFNTSNKVKTLISIYAIPQIGLVLR